MLGSGKNLAPATGGASDLAPDLENLIFTSGGGVERLRITSGGDVGINVTPTSGVKLQVGTPNSTAGVLEHILIIFQLTQDTCLVVVKVES